MRQIKGKPYTTYTISGESDVTGEITIDDITLFDLGGRMSKVCLMWETVKTFARLLDNAHAKEILSLGIFTAKQTDIRLCLVSAQAPTVGIAGNDTI